MDDLILESLVESNENLDGMDSELVKLESQPRPPNCWPAFFEVSIPTRECGFLRFNKLQALAHAGENLLSKLRDGTLALTPEISSALLATVDGIRQMLVAISTAGQDGEETFGDVIETLKRLREGAAAPSETVPRLDPPAPAEPVMVPPAAVTRDPQFPGAMGRGKKKKLQAQPGKLDGALIERQRIQSEDLARAREDQETGDARPLGRNPDLAGCHLFPGSRGRTQIRRLYPKLPVTMFNTLTEHGAAETLEGLALGATDYAAKPTSSEGARFRQAAGRKRTHTENYGPSRGHGTTAARRHGNGSQPSTNSASHRRRGHRHLHRRPNPLAEVIPAWPQDLPVPVLVVPHMPALFTRLLAKHLNGRARLAVEEGSAALPLEADHIWIAPGDFHMAVARDGEVVRIVLSQDPQEHSCRPEVDVLFRSVARTFGPHAPAIVMTGMGSDGALGAKAIRQAGGEVLIQDAATSVVWGMPEAVAAAGFADQVCAFGHIAPEIIRRVGARRSLAARAAQAPHSART